MLKAHWFAPSNSVVLIADPSGGQIPETMDGAVISATPSCIAVGCRSELDGETEFVLGASGEVEAESLPSFEGSLNTPSFRVRLSSILDETILEIPVKEPKTMIRVWVNDDHEPDKVTIGVA